MDSWMAKELRQFPEQLVLYQKLAQTFIENILDIDRMGRDVQKNMRENYALDQPRASTYQPHCGGVLQRNTAIREYKRHFAWIKAWKISEEFSD